MTTTTQAEDDTMAYTDPVRFGFVIREAGLFRNKTEVVLTLSNVDMREFVSWPAERHRLLFSRMADRIEAETPDV